VLTVNRGYGRRHPSVVRTSYGGTGRVNPSPVTFKLEMKSEVSVRRSVPPLDQISAATPAMIVPVGHVDTGVFRGRCMKTRKWQDLASNAERRSRRAPYAPRSRLSGLRPCRRGHAASEATATIVRADGHRAQTALMSLLRLLGWRGIAGGLSSNSGRLPHDDPRIRSSRRAGAFHPHGRVLGQPCFLCPDPHVHVRHRPGARHRGADDALLAWIQLRLPDSYQSAARECPQR
jgi:hypothetical protein